MVYYQDLQTHFTATKDDVERAAKRELLLTVLPALRKGLAEGSKNIATEFRNTGPFATDAASQELIKLLAELLNLAGVDLELINIHQLNDDRYAKDWFNIK